MQPAIKALEEKGKKHQVVDVRSGDTVRVHQRIQEGSKSRVQVFEGLVIRTDRKQSLTSRITVRRIASGVGVEKSFLLHSPLVEKIEVMKRSKVRRNNLSYMRRRSGKSARLSGMDFDKDAVNTIEEQIAAAEPAEAPAEAEATPEVTEEKVEAKEEKKEEIKKES
jgi:large subunit ribosomal protein L19